MISFLGRWLFRIGALAVLALVFVDGSFGAVVGWIIFGYLVWRALPGIRRDFGAFRRIGTRVKTSSGIARF